MCPTITLICPVGDHPYEYDSTKPVNSRPLGKDETLKSIPFAEGDKVKCGKHQQETEFTRGWDKEQPKVKNDFQPEPLVKSQSKKVKKSKVNNDNDK